MVLDGFLSQVRPVKVASVQTENQLRPGDSLTLLLVSSFGLFLSDGLPFPRSHPRLQPAAQDPELRGGPRSGPDQRADAPPPRQHAAGGSALPQQPAGQHRTPGQERHQRPGLVPPHLASSSSLPPPPPVLPHPLRAEGMRRFSPSAYLFYHRVNIIV